jgi:hypothetical protein
MTYAIFSANLDLMVCYHMKLTFSNITLNSTNLVIALQVSIILPWIKIYFTIWPIWIEMQWLMCISEQAKSPFFWRETIQKLWDSYRILLLISVRGYNHEWTRPRRQNPLKRGWTMCFRILTSACLISPSMFYSCPVHSSYQENTVGKQEKFKDIKWVIIHNKLRIANTLVKRKNRTQDRTIIYKN